MDAQRSPPMRPRSPKEVSKSFQGTPRVVQELILEPPRIDLGGPKGDFAAPRVNFVAPRIEFEVNQVTELLWKFGHMHI